MDLSPTELAAIAGTVMAAIYMAHRDDPRWWRWLRLRRSRNRTWRRMSEIRHASWFIDERAKRVLP